jgi:hypothetical protein
VKIKDSSSSSFSVEKTIPPLIKQIISLSPQETSQIQKSWLLS